ncbi:hypothetical protein HUU53_04060 [Candidatus Micrarchaeota archaeon]|nr:hypothetical protein [Candidatus Micrarchaeota archaeon]
MMGIVALLKEKSVSKVRFSPNSLSLVFDGCKLRFKVVKKNTCMIGNWSRSKDELYYDDHFTDPVEVESICIHEAVEKYVSKTYGLTVQGGAHAVAQEVERKWFESKQRDWVGFNKNVTKVWKLHGSC